MDENPYKAPVASDVAWHTRMFLMTFYLLAVISGIREARPGEPSATDLLFPLAIGICLGLWAVADANRRKRPIPFNVRWLFVVLGSFLVPCYVVWSRGWRGVGWVLANAIAWGLLSTAVTWSVILILEGGLPN